MRDELRADLDAPWRQQAACAGADVALFEAAGKGLPPIEALRLCQGCPVRGDCLAAALALPEQADALVWGGTTFNHRLRVRRGGWTAAQAMAAGDRVAAGRTADEQLADEPWLDAREAAPVYIRRKAS